MKWEVQLNDSVLSLCSYEEDEQCQVFAGLADGTMAVIEVCNDPASHYFPFMCADKLTTLMLYFVSRKVH